MNLSHMQRDDLSMNPAVQKLIDRYGVTAECREFLAAEPRQFILQIVFFVHIILQIF